jgi:hypothetical protein
MTCGRQDVTRLMIIRIRGALSASNLMQLILTGKLENQIMQTVIVCILSFQYQMPKILDFQLEAAQMKRVLYVRYMFERFTGANSWP